MWCKFSARVNREWATCNVANKPVILTHTNNHLTVVAAEINGPVFLWVMAETRRCLDSNQDKRPSKSQLIPGPCRFLWPSGYAGRVCLWPSYLHVILLLRSTSKFARGTAQIYLALFSLSLCSIVCVIVYLFIIIILFFSIQCALRVNCVQLNRIGSNNKWTVILNVIG